MKNLDLIKAMIFNEKEDIKYWLGYWRFHQKKIVFTNGCFDILHQGHIDYLANAADLGDVLIVGLNTDDSVARIKGKGRPIQDQTSRAMILSALHFVEAVVLFNEDTPYELIKFVKPDVLVKGSDYQPEDIVGYDVVKEKGGEIITIEFLEGFSTSKIIRKASGISK
jgi:rfaE bifunctional protein nucleotidyltransferase chain/domain